MATIELKQVEKRFGDFQAVQPMDLTIDDGEFVVLLGPSGCGKTTTLRMISGLEAVSGGNILVDGRDVTWHHPSARDIAFVFQFYALYPHISVRKNITFPLEAQKESKETISDRLSEVVRLLRINHLLTRRPQQLSGGDQQRIALARALVRRPKAFLMDEPIGALDAEFRETMRAEIKRLHINQGATTIYVTHDQIEAMAMGDRIVVMSDAVVQQVGTPDEVYYDPSNIFVARFIGSPGMNLSQGRYSDGAVSLPGSNQYVVPERWKRYLDNNYQGEEIILGFRPEGAVISKTGQISAEIYTSDLHGAFMMLHLTLNPEDPDTILHLRAGRGGHHDIGEKIQFDIEPGMVRFFDRKTEKALLPEE